MIEPDEGMKIVRVTVTYEVNVDAEVPEDYEWDGRAWDDEWGEQADEAPHSAVDWNVR